MYVFSKCFVSQTIANNGYVEHATDLATRTL